MQGWIAACHPITINIGRPWTLPYGIWALIRHAWYIDMLAWWCKLEAVPNLADAQEFAWRVRVSSEVPRAWCWVLGVENDNSALPAPKHLGKDWFLPLPDPQMGSQDYQILQPKKTLVYAKALQYWAEEAQLPNPGKPHHLVESILELWWAMEPVTTFSDSEVLDDTPSLGQPIPLHVSVVLVSPAGPTVQGPF